MGLDSHSKVLDEIRKMEDSNIVKGKDIVFEENEVGFKMSFSEIGNGNGKYELYITGDSEDIEKALGTLEDIVNDLPDLIRLEDEIDSPSVVNSGETEWVEARLEVKISEPNV